ESCAAAKTPAMAARFATFAFQSPIPSPYSPFPIPVLYFSRMADQQDEQTYDDGRARNLEALLRALAERIQELDGEGRLLEQAGELMKLIGDVRSELFHYEVRVTYDTPEIAEHRRIVSDAEKPDESKWQTSEWHP